MLVGNVKVTRYNFDAYFGWLYLSGRKRLGLGLGLWLWLGLGLGLGLGIPYSILNNAPYEDNLRIQRNVI